MIPISATILTKNSEKYLTEVLTSLEALDEVIILDNGSSDSTLEIVKKFKNTHIYKSEFIGFGPLKNLAASYAKNDWIFSIDSDEVASTQLIHDLKKINRSNGKKLYIIKRENYFLNQLVRHSGWGKDHLIRIYNREHHSFTNAHVHESIEMKKKSDVKILNGTIKHYAVDDILSFLTKIKRYSSLERKKKLKKLNPTFILLRSFFAFFKTYILKKGFLDGYIGLVIAVSDANGVFYKYMRVYSKESS